jgi:serine/threonine protein phosphatase PrpC
VIDGNSVRFGHIGDSRLYVFRKGTLPWRTYDHSVVNVLYKTGRIKEKEIRRHPDRNKLLRVIGEAESFKPEICEEPVQLEAGDAVLMCTDGFWEFVLEKEMKRVLSQSKSPENWLRGMERLILRRAKKGHDNYSAIAVIG